jgi:SAM-dependent methyltransferase
MSAVAPSFPAPPRATVCVTKLLSAPLSRRTAVHVPTVLRFSVIVNTDHNLPITSMQIMTLLRRKIRGLLQIYGPSTAKRKLWDREYQSGKWDCLDKMRGDCLYDTLESYSKGSSVLDLGSGPGTTCNEIAGNYLWYTGVDISELALEKARRRTAETGRPCEFVCSDIATYVPGRLYDVIVCGDSLYYLPESSIEGVLHRYSGYLSPKGVFIARVRGVFAEWFDSAAPPIPVHGHVARRRSLISTILNRFVVIKCDLHHYDEVICVVVFRPHSVSTG